MAIPRIAICGIHIESSTFTPYLSDENDFIVTRGKELLQRYNWDPQWATRIEWLPILHARALPGGVVKAGIYSAWKKEICEGLIAAHTNAPLDGIFFDIHGAMSVEGYDDAEGDLIRAIREAIGAGPMISASMDLHGNVSTALFEGCDLLTCYRLAPHEDALESRERAVRNLALRLLHGQGKPCKALVHVPVLLPGEKTSTRIEPAKSLYGLIPDIEAEPGVSDAAIWIGFAWADQPRSMGAVVTYGDEESAVRAAAEKLATAFWEARHDFEFVAPTASMEECLDWALSAQRPTFISDTGDNPGAGGAGDTTVALNALLHWSATAPASVLRCIYASIVDPQAAALCWEKENGEWVDIELGGKIDSRMPGPLSLHAQIVSRIDDSRGGKTVAIACDNVTIIVTSARNQYTEHQQFARLGLDILSADVVVVKIGYLEPDLFAAQKDWRMALTPGGVDQDLLRLGHQRITRPLFPFDSDMPTPDLRAQVVTP